MGIECMPLLLGKMQISIMCNYSYELLIKELFTRSIYAGLKKKVVKLKIILINNEFPNLKTNLLEKISFFLKS